MAEECNDGVGIFAVECSAEDFAAKGIVGVLVVERSSK